MIRQIAILLMFQLAGETISRGPGLPVPGPVIGMVMLAVSGVLWPAFVTYVRPLALGILANLSLLFVPAGVGVVRHIGLLAENGAAILAVLVLSTLVTLLVSVGVFLAVSRWTGGTE